MERFRGTDVGLTVVVIAVNVAFVVALVIWVSGRNDEPPLPTASGTTPTASPSTAPTVKPSPSPSGAPAILARTTPITIAVLGDQTSDGKGEWVAVFAELLGRDHQVTLHQLDPEDPTVYADEQSFGSSGPEVTIYNGSRADARADYAAQRLTSLAPDKPDLVVLNYGRNDSEDEVGDGLASTATAVHKAWNDALVVATLQPPTTDDRSKDVREEVEVWATESGIGTLDVAQEFIDTGEPNAYVSSRDRTVMSGRGDRLWGQTAYRLLVGSDPPEEDQSTELTASEATATEPATQPSNAPRGTDGSRPRTTTPTEPDPEPTDTVPLPTVSTPPPPTETPEPEPTTTDEPTTPPPDDPPPPD